MCGRFAFFSPREAIQELFDVECTVDLKPRYNVAPTQQVLAVRKSAKGAVECAELRWGLIPSWAKESAIGNRLINARLETVAEKPAFRAAFRRRRCAVFADGFYEWQPTAQGPKQPWFIHSEGGQPFLMAALWEHWDKGESPLQTCTLLTRAAAGAMKDIHHRMPVILAADTLRPWLDAEGPDDAMAVLERNAETVLAMRRISRAVNSPLHEGPDLIEPAGD
jgi:putative SOS response-associated peptidase YedK